MFQTAPSWYGFLYSGATCEGVKKQGNFRWIEGEDNKEKPKETKECQCRFRTFAGLVIGFKLSCFVKVSQCRTHEKDSNIHEIRCFSDYAVVKVEY